MESKVVITPKRYAELMGVSDRTVRNMCTRGEIEAFRIGKLWRIPMAREEYESYANK